MNKFLTALLIFGAAGFIAYLLMGRTDSLPKDLQSDVGHEEFEEAIKEEEERKVVASCNVIAEKSTCIDYIGSMWADADMAELNCKGVGVFSEDKTCPYSEIGGCQSGAGTVTEMIVWAYKEGGGGYDDESVPYARAACNANPATNWTMPEF